jgi:carboxymethylenebutenolidase
MDETRNDLRRTDDQARSLLPEPEVSRRAFAVGTAAAGFALAAVPVQAQTLITTDTTGLVAGTAEIPAADRAIPGYYARPEGNGPFPVLLVVQEIFGIHEHIKDVCRRFAKRGYLAVAPDLYVRQGDPTRIADVQTLISTIVAKVPDAQVMTDLDATVAWAAAQGKGDTGRVGVTGFCWGGRITWLYAAHSPQVKAGVAWYGALRRPPNPLHPRHPADVAAELKAPVLGLYGSADTGIPVEQVDALRAALKTASGTSKAAASSEILLYKDAPHGFYADYRPSFRPDVAAEAWRQCLAWFKANGVA